MIVNPVVYTDEIETWILANLDGWVIESTPEQVSVDENSSEEETETEIETGINPFMTSNELAAKANKVITKAECQMFYEEALDMAFMHTNRLNIEDLSSAEARMFLRAVCKWAASNLWNKYNIRVNNEDMEDTYVQSYGGLLYHSAIKSLQRFINQRITAMSSIDLDE